MSFVVFDPDPMVRVQRAVEDIRAGKMVILVDDEDRENEGDLVMAAEAISPEAVNFMVTHARGLLCLTLTEDKVDALGLPMMSSNNRSPYHTAFTVSIEARQGVTTGISAADRAQTIRTAIRADCGPGDLVTPGHVFPLRARNGGVLVRSGQTEGSVDLARMAGLEHAGVICEVMNDDGSMARMPELEIFGAKHGLRILTIADLIRWRLRHEALVEPQLDAELPTPGLGTFKARVFKSSADPRVHLAVWKGDILPTEPTLVRVQAHCAVGDAFGSMACDCAAQLDASLQAISEAQRGVLVYMNMGGMPTDALLGQLRTHLASERNEVAPAPQEAQLRELGTGAQILVSLGVGKMRLMTNNPRKIVGLEGHGLTVVERVPLVVPTSTHNAAFLRARRERLGHLLSVR